MEIVNLKLILVDPVEELCQEWQQRFEAIETVSVINGYFEDLMEYESG